MQTTWRRQLSPAEPVDKPQCSDTTQPSTAPGEPSDEFQFRPSPSSRSLALQVLGIIPLSFTQNPATPSVLPPPSSSSISTPAPTQTSLSNIHGLVPSAEYATTPTGFVHSADRIPQLYIAVPPQNGPSLLTPHRKVRFVAPCQGPSIVSGRSDSVHMTDHTGYTIRYSGDFENRHQDQFRLLATVLGGIMMVAEVVGGFFANISSRIGDAARSVVSSVHGAADNRDRLNAAGIDSDGTFAFQVVADSHQMGAMEELLRSSVPPGQSITGNLIGIILEDKRKIWVCRRCYECLQRGEPIEEKNYLMLLQYIPLVTKESEMKAYLHNALSVTLLADTLSMANPIKKLVIQIEPAYFEARERTTGAPLRSIIELFNKLGRVLKRQRGLTHLEIHVLGVPNVTSSKVYAGLNTVFRCRSLEILRISGINCILQDKNIKIKCRKLRELSLQHVPFSTEHAANNLWVLIGASRDLVKLKLAQVKLTATSLSVNKSRATLDQFARLQSLDLSRNDLNGRDAVELVRMALAGSTPTLQSLDLSGNMNVGKNECQSILGLLRNKKCQLNKFKMNDTSIDMRDWLSIKNHLSHTNGSFQRYDL